MYGKQNNLNSIKNTNILKQCGHKNVRSRTWQLLPTVTLGRDQLSARNFYENAAGTADIHTLKQVDR